MRFSRGFVIVLFAIVQDYADTLTVTPSSASHVCGVDPSAEVRVQHHIR